MIRIARKVTPKSTQQINRDLKQGALNASMLGYDNVFFRNLEYYRHDWSPHTRLFTLEELEDYMVEPLIYWYYLIDINHYMYSTNSFFRDYVDYIAKAAICRWYVDTGVRTTNFYNNKDDAKFNKRLEKEYLDYCERIDYLHIEEEFKRIVMKMCLEDTVYAWWTEGGNQASLYYLNPLWCQLGDKVNGVWTYKIRVNAVPDYCLDNMPKDLARLIRRGKISINPDVDVDTYFVVPPIQKSFCVKYNDHIMYSYPPFVSIIRAIMRLQKIRDISDSQDEIDALNLIAFEIPVAEDDKLQDHLLLSGPTVAKFTQSANDIVNGLVGILPTPMKATALNLGSNRNIDKSRPITILDEYGDEVSIPKMGGSNVSAAVLNRQIQFTHGKLFGMYKSIANSINLKMHLDGYTYRNYEFSFKLLEMSEFNKTEVRSDLLKQIQVGVATKMQSMAAFGQNPREMIGTSYMENIVLADIPLNSLVYQTAYTQSGSSGGGTQGNGVREGLVNSSGRPSLDDQSVSPATLESRESRKNTGSAEVNTV